MKNIFNTAVRHNITEANINYYAVPFVHPKRKMGDHDFIYMLNGEWKIGQNSESFALKNDSLLILSADNCHYGISPCLAGTKTMYFHVSHEEGDLLAANADNKENKSSIIESLTDASVNRNVKKIFYEIVTAKLSGDNWKAGVLFDLLLCELKATEHQTDITKIGENIKEIIHRSPERFFSNTMLAEMTGVSVKTAETKFKALFGITIHQYILNFKIEQAIVYLKSFPEMQIKEIAYNLGFYDEYHFSKQFKKITGISPLEYRKRHI